MCNPLIYLYINGYMGRMYRLYIGCNPLTTLGDTECVLFISGIFRCELRMPGVAPYLQLPR